MLSLLFWVLAEDLISPWGSDEIAAPLKTVDEQERRSHLDRRRIGGVLASVPTMALPALRRLASLGVTPMREAAASVVETLRVPD